MRFQCVAASIESAAEHWFTAGPIVDAVLASSAVPGILPPVKVGDEHFIDGGIVNSIPVNRAVELGATRIFVMHVGRLDRPLEPPRWPWEVALVAFEIARRHRFLGDLASLPDAVEVHVLPTGQPEPPALQRPLGAALPRVAPDVGESIDRAHDGRGRLPRSAACEGSVPAGPPRRLLAPLDPRRRAGAGAARAAAGGASRRCSRRCSAGAGRCALLALVLAWASGARRRASPRAALVPPDARATAAALRGHALVRRRDRADRAAGRARAGDRARLRARRGRAERPRRPVVVLSRSTPARATRCSCSTTCCAATAGGRGS